MNILKYAVAIVVFSIIVFTHELGHFLFAKKNGVKVEEFAIGMGPKLFGITKGDTLYSIRAFPLGGFCKMLGEDEGSNLENAFCNKSVLSRFQIIFAGPFFNFITALLLFIITALPFGYTTTTVLEVPEGTPAYIAGIKDGDKIVELNESKIFSYDQIRSDLALSSGEELSVVVKREKEKITMNITPYKNEEYGAYLLGVVMKNEKSFLGSFKNGFNRTIGYTKVILDNLKELIVNIAEKEDVSKKVAGPVGIIKHIGNEFSKNIRESFVYAISAVLTFTAILSINLGLVNLLPIPALDGSRLVFLIVEGIRRKPINEKIETYIHFAGFVVLMGLMVLIIFNDFVNL